MKTLNKKTAMKLFAVLLALLTALAPMAAFAEGDDAPVLLSSGEDAPSASADGGATYTIPDDAEDGKMYILGNPDSTSPDPILTTGTQTPEAQPDSGSKDAAEGLSEEELARRKEIYTMVTLIAMAAIIVGLREKRNRR